MRAFRPLAVALLSVSSCVGSIGDGGPSPGAVDDPPPDDGTVSVGPAVDRRLTYEEYFNSLEVVLGVALEPDDYDLPRDERVVGGFRNAAASQLLSLGRVQGYQDIGRVAVEAADWSALLETYAPCTDFTEPCTQGFTESIGRVIMRRPVPPEEGALYTGLFAVAQTEGDDFTAGAKLVTRAMLQSPRFLYRLETRAGEGDTRRVDDYELATRLSFLVWNAAPDRALLDRAAAGDLANDLDAEVTRMLAHPRARRALRQYVEQWLYLDAVPATFDLGPELKEQTYRLFDWLAWEQRANLMEAFISRRAELTGRLAEFYGLTSKGDGWEVYDLSERPERIGVLTHGAVMAARTVNPDSSMIDRGLFVLNDVLCDHVPPPEDPGLQEAIEEFKVPEGSGLSQRERFAQQSEHALCAACHGRFDNLGLPFEVFGSAGQFLTEDNFGNPLTGHGEVDLFDVQAEFDDVQGFVLALRDSERVARCLVEKSLQHAYGRAMTKADEGTLDAAYARFVAGNGTYEELIRAVASAEDFALVEVAP